MSSSVTIVEFHDLGPLLIETTASSRMSAGGVWSRCSRGCSRTSVGWSRSTRWSTRSGDPTRRPGPPSRWSHWSGGSGRSWSRAGSPARRPRSYAGCRTATSSPPLDGTSTPTACAPPPRPSRSCSRRRCPACPRRRRRRALRLAGPPFRRGPRGDVDGRRSSSARRVARDPAGTARAGPARCRQPERAVSDIVGLLQAEPFRERLWTQRMLGLYRCGRQSEALATFTEARRSSSTSSGSSRDRSSARCATGSCSRTDVSTWATRQRGRPPSGCPPAAPSSRAGRGARPRSSRPGPADVDHPDRTRRGRQDAPGDRAGMARAGVVPRRRLVRSPGRDHRPDPGLVRRRSDPQPGPAAGAAVHDLVIRHLATRRRLLVLDNCEQVVGGAADVADRVLETCPPSPCWRPAGSRSRSRVSTSSRRAVGSSPATSGSTDDSPAVDLFLQRLGDLRPEIDLAGDGGHSSPGSARRSAVFRWGSSWQRPVHGPSSSARSPTPWSVTLRPGPQRQRARSALLSARHRRMELPARTTRGTAPAPATFHPERTVHLRRCGRALPPPALATRPRDGAGRRPRPPLTTRPNRSTTPGGPSRFTQLVPIRAHARTAAPTIPPRPSTPPGALWTRGRSSTSSPPAPRPTGSIRLVRLARRQRRRRAGSFESCLVHDPRHDGLRLVDALLVDWHDRIGLIDGARWAHRTLDLPDLDPYDHAWASASTDPPWPSATSPRSPEPTLWVGSRHRRSPVPPARRPPHASSCGSPPAAWVADLHDLALQAAIAATRLCGSNEPHLLLPAKAMIAASHLLTGESHEGTRRSHRGPRRQPGSRQPLRSDVRLHHPRRRGTSPPRTQSRPVLERRNPSPPTSPRRPQPRRQPRATRQPLPRRRPDPTPHYAVTPPPRPCKSAEAATGPDIPAPSNASPQSDPHSNRRTTNATGRAANASRPPTPTTGPPTGTDRPSDGAGLTWSGGS